MAHSRTNRLDLFSPFLFYGPPHKTPAAVYPSPSQNRRDQVPPPSEFDLCRFFLQKRAGEDVLFFQLLQKCRPSKNLCLRLAFFGSHFFSREKKEKNQEKGTRNPTDSIRRGEDLDLVQDKKTKSNRRKCMRRKIFIAVYAKNALRSATGLSILFHDALTMRDARK